MTARETSGCGRSFERVKFTPAHFTLLPHNVHALAESCGHNRRGENSVGESGCISWPFSGPSEPPYGTAAIDRSCTTCAARGRSGSSVTADKPVRVKNLKIL